MRPLLRNAAVTLLLAGLCACGEGTGDSGAGGSSGDGGSVRAVEVPLCGQPGSGFVFLASGGGLIDTATQLLVETGFLYLVVDPSCRFAVYDASVDSLGNAVEGQLTGEQAKELSAFLALQEWDALEPAYGECFLDGGSSRYAYGDRIIDVLSFCGVIDPPPTDFRHDLRRLPNELASRLVSLGEPATGSARYLLWRDEGLSPDSFYRDAPEWPLDFAPDSVAVSEEAATLWDVTVQGADGDDAEQLRSLRQRFLNREFGVSYGNFIPIEQPDGARFRLSVRDVVEFETEDGTPFVPWVDLAQSSGP